MHHKHGPLGNWREFAKEVGIIVLGAVIALGGEQVWASITISNCGTSRRR